VFSWLREPRFAPDEGAVEEHAGFLPVEIIDEDEGSRHAPSERTPEGCIDIELAGGHRLRITGSYDPEALARLIRGLSAP
jgi:transposase